MAESELIRKHPGTLATVEGPQFAEVVANVVADKSDGTARMYTERLQHFAVRLRKQGVPLDKQTVAAYRRHLAMGERITDQALYNLVRINGTGIGLPKLSPHDLRRTFAKLARKGGAAPEDISLALGRASIATTERYRGTELNRDHAAPDAVKLRLTTQN